MEKINKNKYKILLVILIILIAIVISKGLNKSNIVNVYSNNKEEYISVYFNKSVNRKYHNGVDINQNVNFEEILVDRILKSKKSIDMCVYEINLPRIVEALILKASQGVDVRVIIDAKDTDDEYYVKRDKIMRLYVEKMARGRDELIGTEDDVIVFSDSPIFAVTDSNLREKFELPTLDIEKSDIIMGNYIYTGYLLCQGEKRDDVKYYAPNVQMHNKFLVFDSEIVWTGSWNLTVTGTYGTEENMKKGRLVGNIQHCVEIKDMDVARAYTEEFNEMWGSSGKYPNSEDSNFNKRKRDNTNHFFEVDGSIIEIYFSPSDEGINRIVELIEQEADYNVHFSAFAFSDNRIIEALRKKYEGEGGKRTGFKIKGIIDEDSFNQSWSASQKMLQGWYNVPAIVKDNYKRKFHCKTMIIDGGTKSNPIVITGSMNFTNNGDKVNDENFIIVYNKEISDAFIAEFYSRFSEFVE